jgi:hypothetical protein
MKGILLEKQIELHPYWSELAISQLPSASGGQPWIFNYLAKSNLRRLGKHILEHFFHRHGVTAHTAALEKITIATPITILKSNPVRVILTCNIDRKAFKVNAVAFLCIALGFLDLANHPVIHGYFSFMPKGWIKEKSTRKRVPFI